MNFIQDILIKKSVDIFIDLYLSITLLPRFLGNQKTTKILLDTKNQER